MNKSSRRTHKRRSVSAATASATTFISITGKNSRNARTNSSSAIPIQSKSSTHIKRSHSPSSIILIGSNKNPSQRKKQKISHYWALFGKSEQKLVLIDVRNFIERNYLFFNVFERLTNRRFIANVIHQFVM